MDRQRLFVEIEEHLLNDEKPSLYLRQANDKGLFNEYPFDMLSKLKDAPQSPIHHPEGNVLNHTLLVVDEAAKVKEQSADARIFMWAALLHDIGKPATTRKRNGKITAYDHDKVGAKLAHEFLSQFTTDEGFINDVVQLVRWHMQILFVTKDMPFADMQTMKKQTDTKQVALLGLCDRLGRTKVDRPKEEATVRLFLQKCAES